MLGIKKLLKKIWLCIDPTYRQVCGIQQCLDTVRQSLAVPESVIYMNNLNLKSYALHQKTFAEYKNAFAHKTVVLIATGGSAKYFQPIDNAIHVGVNRAYKLNQVTLDYLFASDWRGFTDIEDINKLNYPVKKFYGIMPPHLLHKDDRSILIPESVALRHNAARFYIKDIIDDKVPKCELTMTFDIACQPLTCLGSIVHPAMQFILYTNPQTVFLVGCDTNRDPHFYGTDSNDLNITNTLHGWQAIKQFAEQYYPETQIISINPIGLRGLFQDVYTKEFLTDHPEISNDDVEILDGKSL